MEKVNHSEIIKRVINQAKANVEKGYGPFLAAIYDKSGNLIAEDSNSVLRENCSNCHAEINAIKRAEEKLNTYDLSDYNLSLYITAEPCMMCLGAIMWSGIRNVYYSVSTNDVQNITGFDEGYKPNWIEEFKKRGIEVTGGIEETLGKELLEAYVKSNKKIYNPSRKK